MKEEQPVDQQQFIEDFRRRMERIEVDALRDILTRYHEYLDEHFPLTGYGEASLNNFIHHESLRSAEDLLAGVYPTRHADKSFPVDIGAVVSGVTSRFPGQENLNGTVYVRLKNAWYDKLKPQRQSEKDREKLPAPPPEA